MRRSPTPPPRSRPTCADTSIRSRRGSPCATCAVTRSRRRAVPRISASTSCIQLLPRRVCARACGALLQARRRTARAGSRPAAGGRIQGQHRSTVVHGRSGGAHRRRQRPRRGGGHRLRVAAHGRPPHLVGGCRRNHSAVAARDTGIARCGCSRRHHRGAGLHVVDAARARCHIGAEPSLGALRDNSQLPTANSQLPAEAGSHRDSAATLVASGFSRKSGSSDLPISPPPSLLRFWAPRSSGAR